MTISVNKAVDNSNLLVAYDFSNPKSLVGPAITNLSYVISLATGSGANYAFTSGTETVYIPQLGSMACQFMYIENNFPTSGQCCWAPFSYGSSMTVLPNTLYTYSIVYKCDSGYSHPNFLYHYEFNGSTYVVESGTFSTTNRIHLGGGWYWAWSTFTTQATTNLINSHQSFYYQYPVGRPDRFYVAKVLLCQGDFTALHPRYWPDLGATRATTAAFKDLTGNTSATAVALTYSSDGKPIMGPTPSSSIGLGKTSYTLGIRRTATYTGWVKGSDLSTGAAYLISDYDGVGMTLRINNLTSADFYVYPNNHRITYGSTFASNTWYHLTGVLDGPMMYMYVNGVFAASQTLGEDVGAPTQSLHIGSRGDAEVGAGFVTTGTSVGSVKVFARALLASEILSMFTAERGVYGV
jgi:hypothetical protein